MEAGAYDLVELTPCADLLSSPYCPAGSAASWHERAALGFTNMALLGPSDFAQYPGVEFGCTRTPAQRPMRWLSELAQAARFHSHEMAQFDFFDHATHPVNAMLFDEATTDPFARQDTFLQQGSQQSRAGENIATGSEDPYAVTLSWLRSTDQCNTIFGGFDFVGIGYVQSTGSRSFDHLYTQNLVSFAPTAPAPASYPLPVGWHSSNHVFGGTGVSFFSQFESQTQVARNGVVIVDGVPYPMALEIGTPASGSWFASLGEDEISSASCSEYYFLFEDDAGRKWRLPESPAIQYMTFGISGCTRNSITYTSSPTFSPTVSPTPDEVARPVSHISFENLSSQTKVLVKMSWEEPVSFYPIARYLLVLQDMDGNELQRRGVWASGLQTNELDMPFLNLPLWQNQELEPSTQYKVGIRCKTDPGSGSLSGWSQFVFVDFTSPPLATPNPTAATAHPTVDPTQAPTTTPTRSPTVSPTPTPSATPTESPTASPTVSPTTSPSASPTDAPSPIPTAVPSMGPSASPTAPLPTPFPSVYPTLEPTSLPTPVPTGYPTGPTLLTVSVTTTGWRKAATTNAVFVNFKDRFGATSGDQMLFPSNTVTSTDTEFVSTLEYDLGSSGQNIDFENLKFMYIWLDGNDKVQLRGSQIEVSVLGCAQYVDNKRAGQKITAKGKSKTKIRLLRL